MALEWKDSVFRAVRIGLASARVNLVPMVVLWAMAAALVLGYYHVPWVASVLSPLQEWQDEQGWIAAFLNRFAFCGILPGVFIVRMKTPGRIPQNTNRFRNAATHPCASCHSCNGLKTDATHGTR